MAHTKPIFVNCPIHEALKKVCLCKKCDYYSGINVTIGTIYCSYVKKQKEKNTKMSYTADNLIFDFKNLDKNTLQRIIDSQVSIIKSIVEHIKICRACYLGIYCCEYEEKSLEELWTKLVHYHKQHVCQGEHTLYFMANEENKNEQKTIT